MEVAATLAAVAMRGNAVVGGDVGGLLGCRGIIHNPVHMHLLLHRIVWPGCIIVHPIFVKRTLHPVLQSGTTLARKCNAKPGMMWARHAMARSLGKSNVQVSVDCTWSLSGRCATMGLLASFALVMGHRW